MTVVLDASAVLAYLNGETGHERVGTALDNAVVSTANWAEVLQKITAAGGDSHRIGAALVALGIHVDPLTLEDARTMAALWAITRSAGLSLGDRACLATALRLDIPAVTADKAWKEVDVGVEIELIR